MSLLTPAAMAASLTIEDYLAASSIHPEVSINPNRWKYFCPLHSEKTPSFLLYRDQQKWRCFGGCQDGGTLRYLIHLREGIPMWELYPHEGDQQGKRMEGRQSSVVEPIKTPYASREERAVLTTAMRWWHDRLTLDQSSQARYAYFYLLQQRGVTHRTLRECPQLGFAPTDKDGSYSQAFRSFLKGQSGVREWEDIALKVGLLSQRNHQRMRYQGRVTFSCTFPRHNWEEVWYVQGRTLYNSSTGCKYLGTSSIRKVPFSLPVPFVECLGTVVVESPVGPAVLREYGLSSMATLGEGLDSGWLDQFTPPFFLCQDNDEPKTIKGKDGVVQGYKQPGEIQAQACLRDLSQFKLPGVRVLPPRTQKGVDEWVKHERGTEPLIGGMEQALTHAGMPLPKKWRERVY